MPARLAPSARLCGALACLVLLLSCAPWAAAQSPAATATVKRGLVVLARFPDVPPAVDRDFAAERFRKLDAYVREMSWNSVSLDVELAPDWITLPRAVSEYRIAPQNLNVDRSRVLRLIDDTLNLADPGLDLGRYDFIDILLDAPVQAYGMIGLCGYPGMLGWMSEGRFRTSGGREVRCGVAIFCRQAHLGTLFHDTAHVLAGVANGRRVLPCLYDHDLQAKAGPPREVFLKAIVNMGFFDPMSCHFYQWELPPPGISSWSRLRLGWLPESRVRTLAPGEQAEVLLGPLEDPASQVAVVRIPLSSASAYLIENRQPLGFDRFLPGHGVLVMRTDETVAECRHGAAPVKLVPADPSLPHLEGAAYDATRHRVFTDPGHGIRMEIVEQTGGTFRLRFGKP